MSASRARPNIKSEFRELKVGAKQRAKPDIKRGVRRGSRSGSPKKKQIVVHFILNLKHLLILFKLKFCDIFWLFKNIAYNNNNTISSYINLKINVCKFS